MSEALGVWCDICHTEMTVNGCACPRTVQLAKVLEGCEKEATDHEKVEHRDCYELGKAVLELARKGFTVIRTDKLQAERRAAQRQVDILDRRYAALSRALSDECRAVVEAGQTIARLRNALQPFAEHAAQTNPTAHKLEAIGLDTMVAVGWRHYLEAMEVMQETRPPRTDGDFLHAELAQLDRMLLEIPEGEVLTRESLESRREQVRKELEDLED